MQRISSTNARPDVNGIGKHGFHNNEDLPGQDATYLTPDFLNFIQEEICSIIEKNGHALDPNSKQQLFDILATEESVLTLAEAIEQRFQQQQQDQNEADGNLQQQLSDLSQQLQQQISNLVKSFGSTYPKVLMAGVLTSNSQVATHIVNKPSSQAINFLDPRYAILLQVEARYNNGFYMKRNQDSFEVYLNVDDGRSGSLNSRNINYVVYETEGILSDTGDGDYAYTGNRIAIPILAGESKSFLIVGAGGGGGSSRYEDLATVTNPEYLTGVNGEGSYISIDNTTTIFTAGGGIGGGGGIDANTAQYINGTAGAGGTWSVNGDVVSATRTNGTPGNATSADHSGASTASNERGAGGDGADGWNIAAQGFGGGGGEGARLSIVYKNTTENTQYATLYVGKAGAGEKSLNTYNEDGELITSPENYLAGLDGNNGFIRVARAG